MTRNNLLFKILFAIELALLPMVIFAYLFLAPWAMGVFIAGVLLAKVWLHMFNDKTISSTIIMSVGNILVFAVLLILFMANSLISVALGVAVIILVVVYNVLKITLHGKVLNETIDAVDCCYTLFECLSLAAFTFLVSYSLVSNIGLFAMILTSAVSVAYKIFYTFKYTNFVTTIKNLFRRK